MSRVKGRFQTAFAVFSAATGGERVEAAESVATDPRSNTATTTHKARRMLLLLTCQKSDPTPIHRGTPIWWTAPEVIVTCTRGLGGSQTSVCVRLAEVIDVD